MGSAGGPFRRRHAIADPLDGEVEAGDVGVFQEASAADFAGGGEHDERFDVDRSQHVQRGEGAALGLAGLGLGRVQVGELQVEGDEDRAWVVDGRRAASRDPWHDLVLWGAGRSDRDGGPLVWVDGGRTMVRTMELVRAAKDYDWRLPGGSKAFNNYLVERFGQSYWSISEKTEYGRATVLGDTVEGIESDT